MRGLEEVGYTVIGIVVDENGTQQSLFGVDVAWWGAVLRLGSLNAGDQGIGGGHLALRKRGKGLPTSLAQFGYRKVTAQTQMKTHISSCPLVLTVLDTHTMRFFVRSLSLTHRQPFSAKKALPIESTGSANLEQNEN
jgi:hypothetical protein